MATKPTFAPPQFGLGVGGLYTAGARSGDPTTLAIPDSINGYTPGVIIEPESFNYYIGLHILNWVTNWLALGSNAAGLTAHVMETDASGLNSTAAMQIGGTSHPSALAAFTVTNNSGSGASRAILASATTNVAIEASNASLTNGAIVADNSSTGPAFKATPSGGGVGIEIECLITNSIAARFTGFGTGAGLVSRGGVNGIGMQGIGGDSTAFPGAQGIADHPDANGTEGVTKLAANAGAAGIKGLGRGNGNGVLGEADDGYGVIAEVTGTERAPLRVVPIAAEPASTFAGDIWPDSTTNNLMTEINSQPVGFWATQHGFTRAFGKSTAVSSTTSATFQDKITVTLGAPYEPRIAGGFIEVTASFEFSSSITGSDPFEWRVLDSTDGTAEAIAAQQEHADVSSSTGDTKYVTMTDTYALPDIGARSFKLQWRAVGGSGNSRIRRASLSIKGVYPS